MADASGSDAGPDPFQAINENVAALAALPKEMSSLRRYLACATAYDKQRSASGIVLAYYIRMFATQLAINKYQTNKDCTPYLMTMLDACEKCKPIVDSITDRDELTTYKIVEDAAVKLFYAADKADRAGKCDQRTAQAFMKASTLFEALTEVMKDAENDPKMVELDNYAKNKATYILKCLREGVQPLPGPSAIGVADNAPPQESTADPSPDWGLPSVPQQPPPPTDNYGMPQAPTNTFQPEYGMPQVPAPVSSADNFGMPQVPESGGNFSGFPPSAPDAPPAVQPPSQPAPSFTPAPPQPFVPAATPPAVMATPGTSFTPRASVSIAEEKEATKAAKFAISALQHSDTATAVKQLLEALKILCK
mmetsp:Transcript_94032/g.130589  ORF Transcript_94032/g.130589 Transcript_94032/m.130589 type:complete len:364 (+) Transcript_94032:39-1130(+)